VRLFSSAYPNNNTIIALIASLSRPYNYKLVKFTYLSKVTYGSKG